jgi:hypothetical protein
MAESERILEYVEQTLAPATGDGSTADASA